MVTLVNSETHFDWSVPRETLERLYRISGDPTVEAFLSRFGISLRTMWRYWTGESRPSRLAILQMERDALQIEIG